MTENNVDGMDWKKYEDEIWEHFRSQYPDAQITKNAKIVGRYSLVERQIDVLIEGVVADFSFRIAVDAKYRGRAIDVTDVEAFIGFCDDLSAKGVLIALNGFTPAAVQRAHNDLSDIELDVLNFKDLKEFQGFVALPYSGKNGVAISAPFGWVIDATQRGLGVANLYQRGYSFEEATQAKEWMYINFWTKDERASTLEELLFMQEENLLNHCEGMKITYSDGPQRKHGVTRIRSAVYPPEVTLIQEHAGFVEFEAHIVFFVLLCPKELVSRNIRKLRHLLRVALPFAITYA